MAQNTLDFDPEDDYDPDLVHVLEDNIRTSFELQKKNRQRRSFEQRLSDRVTSIAGRFSFLYFHLVLIVFHILINSGWFGNQPYDPFPFSINSAATKKSTIIGPKTVIKTICIEVIKSLLSICSNFF